MNIVKIRALLIFTNWSSLLQSYKAFKSQSGEMLKCVLQCEESAKIKGLYYGEGKD